MKFEIPERLKSRKFLMALGTVGAILFGLDPEKVNPILMLVVSYVLGQSYVDSKKL